MSKRAPRQPSPSVRKVWRLMNLIALTIGFLIPVVHDRAFGMISLLNVLSALLLFLPGVVFQAMTVSGKLPGLLLYLAGTLSLIGIVLYIFLGIITCLRKHQRRSFPALLCLVVSGIGAIAVLFLWQGQLAQGAWITLITLFSCFTLELTERGSAKPKANR